MARVFQMMNLKKKISNEFDAFYSKESNPLDLGKCSDSQAVGTLFLRDLGQDRV